MSRVSLYIPCYNAKEYIAQCLEAVFKQTYPIDEILVIDDGPGDETAKIVSHYPVKLIQRRRRFGLPSARNTAIRQARNDFVASLDADCIPKPDWLEQLMNNFANDNIVGIGGMLVERYISNAADKWRATHMAQHWGNEFIENPPFLYGNNTVFKKGALASVGFYNEFYKNSYEDVDLSMRLFESGFELAYNPKAVVEHMRKDTVRSVLATYWQWDYYTHMNPNTIKKMSRTLSMYIGKIVYLQETVSNLFREDLREKNYKLLPIDFLLLFYYTWLDFKFALKCSRF